MKIEEAIPEIRKGRRWRPMGQEDWRGPWKPNEDKVLFGSWRDLEDEFELEPELQVIEVPDSLVPKLPWRVSIKGWGSDNFLDRPLEELDQLKAAADRVRGIAPMAVDEAWEKWRNDTANLGRCTFDCFRSIFTLGQRSACPREVAYVDLTEQEAQAMVSPITYPWQDIIVGHKAGFDACLTQLGGKGV